MTSESTRRKHHRSSGDDAEGSSKRRKHRHHHHRHRHHHHRDGTDKEKEEAKIIGAKILEVEKVDEIEYDKRKLGKIGDEDGGSLGEVLFPGGLGFHGGDYEMEEGEIVEDDGHVDSVNQDPETSEKDFHSDVESGEIETNENYHSNMGVNEANVETHHKLRKSAIGSVNGKRSGEMAQDMILDFNGLANGYCLQISHKFDDDLLYGDGKRIIEYVDGVEQQSLRRSPSLEKRPRVGSPYHSHDRYVKESSNSSLSKLSETSVEDFYYMDGKDQSESDNGKILAHPKICQKSSKDSVMEKERKHGSSRYVDRKERHHRRASDAYREGCRDRAREKKNKNNEMIRESERKKLQNGDSWDREMLKDRIRPRDKERGRESEQERDRRRDGESERERERDLAKDRVRDERIKNMDRGKEGGGDCRRGTLNEYVWVSRHKKFDKPEDGKRYGDNESLHRRNSEDYHKERPRSNFVDITSKKQEELGNNNIEREGNAQDAYQEEIAVHLEEQEEDDLEKIKEESRRLRQAILEKYKNQQQQSGAQSNDIVKHQIGESGAQVANGEVIQEQHENQLEFKDVYAPESSVSGQKSPSQNHLGATQMATGTGGLGDGTPESERSNDIFCDDIFGESPAETRKLGKGDGLAIEKIGLHDNWDDAEGYYGYRIGEILDGRYEIIAAHGKGVFSTVVRAKDLRAKLGDSDEVAIKIIRSNETMYKAGMEELIILKKLVGADLENRRHCVRFLSTFKYRNHLCLVFESLNMNLREVLKKFGRNIGLKLTAVRAYAKQLFIALKHLKNCGVLHCDIKPDNMLVNEAKNILKLCDFGSAMFAGKNEITPYLVSRFYRAPEIILGLPYDHPLDIWSVGCCLFELYTGKVLFPGATNNDMLRLHMELKGPFPKKMLRKGAFTNQHFDQHLHFLATEEDPVSKKAIRKLIVNVKPKDFGTLISASPGEDQKMVANFKDLMDKIFVLDPDKRLNVSQALNHPFITGK